MKHNVNKNKLNFREVIPDIHYNRYRGQWIIEYFFNNKTNNYFRNPRHHRNKIYAKNHKAVIDNWDDIKISRNYRNWKDRTKRKHQYKIEDNDDFYFVKRSGNI